MNDCVQTLRQDQIMLLREFRRLNLSQEGTTQMEISTRHRQFLESLDVLPSKRRSAGMSLGRHTSSQSHLNHSGSARTSIDNQVQAFDSHGPDANARLRNQETLHLSPLPGQSNSESDSAYIKVVKLCSLDNENAELTPFRLTEIGLVADALRDQTIQVFGISVTTGLVVTIVSLLLTNLATIISKVIT